MERVGLLPLKGGPAIASHGRSTSRRATKGQRGGNLWLCPVPELIILSYNAVTVQLAGHDDAVANPVDSWGPSSTTINVITNKT